MADNNLCGANGLSHAHSANFLAQVHQPQAQPAAASQAPVQQKRQHSSSYQMPNTVKRSVTQPPSPAVLQTLAVESGRATAGTTTPANGSSFPTQLQSPSHDSSVVLQHQQQIHHQLHPQQQHQEFSIQQQVPQFKPTFNINVNAPIPQIADKGKKFSQTFVNQTYTKSRTPEVLQSPSLSVNRAKFDTTSYLNNDRTDVNDFNDTSSLAYTQTVHTSQQQAPQQLAQMSTRPVSSSTLPQPSIPFKSSTPSIMMKEANAESPGSTISEASTNPTVPPVTNEQPANKLTDEEQQVITKLQDTYKTIIRLENTLQRRCAALNVPQRLDMSELWEIYNIDIQLLNSYYDFLLYSMSSGRSGKQIVEVYRIPRRLWVFGIVTFLDVLKNVVSIFIEHDLCSSFISYAFNILTGLADLELEGWLCEKLGDLSRMAIALYPSRFIDWKVSSEYWYATAMKTQYGFGKIYYHIATVQLDNLDALVNIGRSVFCRDPFVPTPQYMRMVIDNINQRSYVDLPVLDFIKVHKILLSEDIVNESELNKLITFYARNLGVDNNSVDFFVRTPGVFNENIVAPEYSQDNDYENKFHFWFQRSSSFALVNIYQMVGFGNPSNPFARLFGLQDALKERKERKERKDKRKKANSESSDQQQQQQDPEEHDSIQESTIEEWFETNSSLNKFAVKVAIKMMIVYLKGPLVAGLPFVITMLYFLLAIGEAMKKYPTSKPYFETLILTIIPLNSLIRYLNELLDVVRLKPEILEQLAKYQQEDSNFMKGGFLNYFNQHENLIEVWKCWGSLWYDSICLKEEYATPEDTGISKFDILDVPIGGPRCDKSFNNDRFIRVILLASYIADNFNFGIKRFENCQFGFHVEKVYRDFEFSEETRKFVKDKHLEIFKAAKTFDLVESVEIQPSWTTISQGDVLDWINANGGSRVTIDSSQVINYADNDADFEDNGDGGYDNEVYDDDEDDEEEGDDEGHDDDEDEDDDGIVTDVDEGMEQIASVATTSFSQKPPSFILTADSGILVGKTVTYFILDTNIWLKHCGKMFKSLKSRLFKLAVPLVVFQELRSLRCSPDATVADSATRAVIALRQLGSEGCLVPLKMDGTEAPSLNDVADFESNKSWMQSIDDAIINSIRYLNANIMNAYHEQNIHNLDTVNVTVLITEDRNMRLKSRTRNVAAFQGKWFFDVVEKFSEGKACNN